MLNLNYDYNEIASFNELSNVIENKELDIEINIFNALNRQQQESYKNKLELELIEFNKLKASLCKYNLYVAN